MLAAVRASGIRESAFSGTIRTSITIVPSALVSIEVRTASSLIRIMFSPDASLAARNLNETCFFSAALT